MLGRLPALARATGRAGLGLGLATLSGVVASAAARIARPAPAISPPASSPPFRNVRRSTLLCSFGSMLSMRALLILGPGVVLGVVLLAGTASAGQSAPTCAPDALNNSALQDGLVTVSPLAGSRDASPQAQISFLGVSAADLSHVSVVGSRPGLHSGRLAAYSQGDGASFLPSRPFAEGELVTVRARLRVGAAVRSLEDEFAIARQDSISSTPERIHPGEPSEVQGFHSRPDLHPPVVAVTASSPAAPRRGGRRRFRRALLRAGAGGPDDPRPERRPAVVQATAHKHLRHEPPGAGISGPAGAHLVAGRHLRARLRTGPGRDRRSDLHGHRAGARRQRASGGPARLPADAAGNGADHRL